MIDNTVLAHIIKDRNITINGDEIYVIIGDNNIQVDDCVWGYYLYNENLNEMNMYITDKCYDTIKNIHFGYDKKIVDSNNFMLSTNTSLYIEEVILQQQFVWNRLSLGNVRKVKHDIISCNTHNIGTIDLSYMIILDNKKDLSKFKLCYRYPYIVLPVSL